MIGFHVGQKVVCVDADHPCDPRYRSIPWDNRLVKGRIYTIRWIGEYRPTLGGLPTDWSYIGVRLAGVTRRRKKKDSPFKVERFRPVISRSTDISIFQKLLTPLPCKETA